MIAIKNADGTLVPVIESTVGSDRTVALSLVHNHQKRAEILLFELPDTEQASHIRELPQAEAFGKLVLRRLPDNPFGEVEIQARLSIDTDFNVHVVAGAVGEKTVSGTFRIPSLSTSSAAEIPIYEEEESTLPVAELAVLETEADAFIDDPDDTDWGFDELANPEDEETMEAPAIAEDAFGDDDAIDDDVIEEEESSFDEELPEPMAEMPTEIDDDFSFGEESEPENLFDTNFDTDNSFDSPLDEPLSIDTQEAIAESFEESFEAEEEDSAPVLTTKPQEVAAWSGFEVGFLRASIILFGLSLLELGTFFFIRLYSL